MELPNSKKKIVIGVVISALLTIGTMAALAMLYSVCSQPLWVFLMLVGAIFCMWLWANVLYWKVENFLKTIRDEEDNWAHWGGLVEESDRQGEQI